MNRIISISISGLLLMVISGMFLFISCKKDKKPSIPIETDVYVV